MYQKTLAKCKTKVVNISLRSFYKFQAGLGRKTAMKFSAFSSEISKNKQ